MDEAQYLDLRRILWYLFFVLCVLWYLVYRQALGLDRLRAAFIHFATCPKCRGGQTHVRAEAEGAYE